MNTIRSMWTEKTIGLMEKLSIASYLYHGVPYHLYLYEDVKDVPVGAVIHDAREILPQAEIKNFRHPQQFADYFRYAMLLMEGGWHADLDSVCLKPFDIATPYVFVRDNIDEYYLSGCFMKTPAGAPIMQHCFDAVGAMSVKYRIDAGYQEVGPKMVHKSVLKFGLQEYVQPKLAFDPIPWDQIKKIVDPYVKWDLSQSYAIHLRGSIWNNGPNASAGRFPNGSVLMSEDTYNYDCLYEQLKRKYL
jgi:mannosyltransferase OCH1-like enzyme